jgi:hypothetical protein
METQQALSHKAKRKQRKKLRLSSHQPEQPTVPEHSNPSEPAAMHPSLPLPRTEERLLLLALPSPNLDQDLFGQNSPVGVRRLPSESIATDEAVPELKTRTPPLVRPSENQSKTDEGDPIKLNFASGVENWPVHPIPKALKGKEPMSFNAGPSRSQISASNLQSSHRNVVADPPQWWREEWKIKEVLARIPLSESEAREKLRSNNWDLNVIPTSHTLLIIGPSKEISS